MKTILAVDDSVTNLKFVEEVLKDSYKSVLVKSGEQALKYLMKHSVDLILLDLMMPEMDGMETFEKIKLLENNHNVPVVFLTADTDVESEINCLKMGAVDFIRKPFVPEVMLNRINRAVELEELTRYLERRVDEKTVQIEQMSFESIAMISGIIEAKDSYTKGHSVRVAEYSALIAKEANWKEDDIRNLKYIALLHDIGKVGIPDQVLNKPGKLTEQEFDIIKSHTTMGGDILKDITTIADAASGAKYHHERYDGRGYPCGLVGDEIPATARIICIADAYDAMSSKRVYRDSLAPEIIRRELVNGKGTQFDPNFLELFLRLFDSGKLVLTTEEAEEKRTVPGESAILLNQIMKSMEEEAKKKEEPDYLTGLLNRKAGETKIANAMKEMPGCLAYVDVDNLKRTNDSMGHLAGDSVLKTVSEVLLTCGKNAIIARVGGDEFLFYMVGADRGEAVKIVEQVMEEFRRRREMNAHLSNSSLSIGLCVCTPADNYLDIFQKTDKALYHVKQSGKCGYYFHATYSGGVKRNASVDLERLVTNLAAHDSYKGTLSVEYRDFAKIYDFICHLVERYDYNMQLIMVTLEITNDEKFYIDEKEYAMTCLEKTIQTSLRTVDVCTRFSGEQFLIAFFNANREDIVMITNRVFEKFYAVYDRKSITLSYDIAEIPGQEK